MQPPLLAIPESQSEHTGAALQGALKTPGFDGNQEGFGVGMAAPGFCQGTNALELLAQVVMVVNLAVEHELITPTGTGHGLMPGRGEVHNRQTLMSKRQTGFWVNPDPGIVRSAMLQGWDKFCFRGGVLEIRAKLPGRWDVGGLWPGLWMMGNLARATYVASSQRMWPFSHEPCDRSNQRKQEVSGCAIRPHFGLNSKQGRGAPEIDLLEVMPGADSA